MGQLVVMGAMCTCSMGVAPASLTVLPTNMVMGCSVPAATIMDFQPMVNIATFGMCQSPSNPTVAAATAAALGVLTPMPCIPMTTSPWTPGASKVTIKGNPALTADSKCMCTWGGSISITNPGQTKIQVT